MQYQVQSSAEGAQFKLNILWLAFVSGLMIVLVGCAKQTDPGVQQTSKKIISNNIASVTPPAVNPGPTPGPAPSPATAAPLEFEVDGMGNHAQHICIPARTRLIIRMKPHPNYAPLLPPDPTLVYPGTTTPVYDGSPAYYSQLRVRMSIPGTAAAWDYLASNENYSVPGDYSSYLTQINSSGTPTFETLPTPEYTDINIFGSDPNDGMCTYWENQLGKCSHVSGQLRTSEYAGCNPGEQKILITRIVSDYPCQNDILGWCRGGSIQIVPDYQHWSITVQAMTENTKSFLQ